MTLDFVTYYIGAEDGALVQLLPHRRLDALNCLMYKDYSIVERLLIPLVGL